MSTTRNTLIKDQSIVATLREHGFLCEPVSEEHIVRFVFRDDFMPPEEDGTKWYKIDCPLHDDLSRHPWYTFSDGRTVVKLGSELLWQEQAEQRL